VHPSSQDRREIPSFRRFRNARSPL
jgi:hypothetical protein